MLKFTGWNAKFIGVVQELFNQNVRLFIWSKLQSTEIKELRVKSAFRVVRMAQNVNPTSSRLHEAQDKDSASRYTPLTSCKLN